MLDLNTILMPIASLGGMGLLFGLGLGYAGVKFQTEEDERLPLVRDALPGANCGGCGFAGCDAFAAAVVAGTAKTNGCPVGGATSAQKIADVLGLTAEAYERKCSFVKCGGDCTKAQETYNYFGISDCTAMAHLAGGGPKACTYGCLGGGNCVRACMFDALSIRDGVAVVNRENCTACGKCVEACPKHLVSLVPYSATVKVACNSKDNGKVTRGNCAAGCIGCKLCEKACPADAVHVTDFLAQIDYDKCTQCGACVEKCPTKVITVNA